MQGQARPSASMNTLESNVAGIGLDDASSGAYSGNIIRNNSGPGVSSKTSQRPTLWQFNTLSGNQSDVSPY